MRIIRLINLNVEDWQRDGRMEQQTDAALNRHESATKKENSRPTVACSVLQLHNQIRRLPSEGNICVSKKIKIEKMYKWECKNKWIKMIEMAQI